jgi:predicted DNA-binding transcriptional regulator YafY
MKQMDRRLLILMRLREERPVRAQDVAEECGCSVRTVYRDIDALCQAGVPVAAMPGEGYRLVPGYHLPAIAFTVEEAMQLLIGSELAVPLGTQEQREASRSAAAKVEAVLRPETRREVDRLRDRIRVGGWRHAVASPWLPALQQSVIHDNVVRLQYHSFSGDELTEREVEPYFLTYYSEDWHLVGYCRLREAMRDFRVGRIRDLRLLEERFERTDIVEEHHRHRDHAPPPEVRVFIESAAVPWARESAGFAFRREEPAEGGSVFVHANYDLRRLLPWILSWGASARVLSPKNVAARVRREAEALTWAYAEE